MSTEIILKSYLGNGMVIDEQLHCEWARIPHFYNAFYVYKYATSLSAAIALAERVSSGEEGAVENYLTFLGAGSHKEPLEILKDAGVDLTGKEVYEVTVNKFRNYWKNTSRYRFFFLCVSVFLTRGCCFSTSCPSAPFVRLGQR